MRTKMMTTKTAMMMTTKTTITTTTMMMTTTTTTTMMMMMMMMVFSQDWPLAGWPWLPLALTLTQRCTSRLFIPPAPCDSSLPMNVFWFIFFISQIPFSLTLLKNTHAHKGCLLCDKCGSLPFCTNELGWEVYSASGMMPVLQHVKSIMANKGGPFTPGFY